jgi:hypothetical protein
MPIESLFCEILIHELGLPPDHVWITGQNRVIPPSDGLFISVGLLGASVIGNVTRFRPQLDAADHGVSFSGLVQVNVFSRSNAAMDRGWEVVAAFNSPFSVALMEKKMCRIAQNSREFVRRIPQIGGEEISHYAITFSAFWQSSKLSAQDSYGHFEVQSGDEKNLARDDMHFPA